jgi:hypothetical protein
MYKGGPVSWRSTMQKSVALSFCEAELVAMTETTKRIIWIRKLLTDLHRSHSGAVRIQHYDKMLTDIRGKKPPSPTSVDNQGTRKIAESTGPLKRSKHIEVQYFYVQEKVQDKSVVLNYAPTDQMRADIFTKALPAIKFIRSLLS